MVKLSNDPLVRYGEWIFRSVLLAAMGVNLWLTQSFVTRKEFDTQARDNISAHLSIQTTVSDIAATMKIMTLNAGKLDDHEARLRGVEARQIDVISRLTGSERTIERIADRAADRTADRTADRAADRYAPTTPTIPK